MKKVAQGQQINSSLEAYLSAVENIDSDHHKADVFKVLSRSSFEDDELIEILRATESINSDHHLADVLIVYSRDVKGRSDAVVDAYYESSEAISSDSHLGRVLRALR